MKYLDSKHITDAFNAKLGDMRSSYKDNKLEEGVQSLSSALAKLKGAGLDIRLTPLAGASEMSFLLFPDQHLTVPVSGILDVSGTQFLIALQTKAGNAPCLRLGLSLRDIRLQGSTEKIQSEVYDLQNDPEAMVKFQKRVIEVAARAAYVFENDIDNAFEGSRKIHKPVLKATP